MDDINVLTGRILDSAFRVHRSLGPGLVESVYESVLEKDLARGGLVVARQRSMSFDYDGLHFRNAFRPDLLVNGTVVVEVKSVQRIHPVHRQQLLTYLRVMDYRIGLLLNFGAPLMKDGIIRIVNRL